MILLHGIGMDWRVWQGMARRLHPWFTLYLVDLRGHGESAKPDHGYTLADYAADIEDMVDLLSLQDVVLVGSSLGGLIAVAVEAPRDIVGHRILVDPPLTGGPIRDPEQFRTILRLKHGPIEPLARFLGGSYAESGARWLRTMSEMWQRAADGVIEDLLATEQIAFSLDTALRADESPTLIVQADPSYGGVLTTPQVEAALQLLPLGTAVQVLGAGHAVHADQPVDFARLVHEFTATSSSSR